jgi:hypothetical protein
VLSGHDEQMTNRQRREIGEDQEMPGAAEDARRRIPVVGPRKIRVCGTGQLTAKIRSVATVHIRN